jgi:heme oxygenase
MAIVDGCPAFSDGCPFSKIDAELLPRVMESLPIPGNVKDKCPAFKDGCPFKDEDSVENLYNKLSDMPSTHQPNQGNAAAKAVEETLRLVHTKSVEMKGKYNSMCPVFATSCPFKTVTTYGSPLVAELDGVIEQWGLVEAEGAAGRLRTASEDAKDGRPRALSEDAALEGQVDGKTSLLGEDRPWERQVSDPLSKSLKTGTKMVHRSAENVHFVRDFLKGSVKKDSYIELLRALYHVYTTMEIALMDLPRHLRHCDFSVLERASALEEDLRYYLGTPDGEAVDFGKPSPAAQQYVDQLELMAKEDPLMLLAHAYTRYLGDLSGGQILARSATKAYGLPEGRGTSFYKFDLVGSTAADLKAFKKAYRSSLDALQISSKRADALVQEANKAFLMNILLFEERDVAAGHLDRIRTLDEVSKLIETNMTPLAFQRAYGTTQTSGVVSQCPFIPGPAGQRKAGEPSFHGDGKVCPWPFIWMHDPKSAMISHPAKNAVGFVTLFGLLRVAWEYPRQSAAAFVTTAFVLPWMKPRNNHQKR